MSRNLKIGHYDQNMEYKGESQEMRLEETSRTISERALICWNFDSGEAHECPQRVLSTVYLQNQSQSPSLAFTIYNISTINQF